MRTTVILKTDIVDSTPRTAALTQAEMGLQRKQHKRFISQIAIEYHGYIFQEEGDAYWIEFPSVTTAVLAAIEMHQTLRNQQAGKGEKQRLAIRAIVTVGDILYQEKDTIGTTLALTARIEGITPPDEIYLSHAAWLILNKAEVQTSFVNEFNLKGFSEPQQVYRVDQKFKTRVLSNHFIVYTDANRFQSFIRTAGVEEVERFLVDCDDLINELCDRHGGIIRKADGDEYFITFTEARQTIAAIEELCQFWKRMVERYNLGISIGVHKGNLNVIRSFVYGEDIKTTIDLSRLGKHDLPGKEDIRVIASRKVKNEFRGTKWENNFHELDPGFFFDQEEKMIASEHRAHLYLVGNKLPE